MLLLLLVAMLRILLIVLLRPPEALTTATTIRGRGHGQLVHCGRNSPVVRSTGQKDGGQVPWRWNIMLASTMTTGISCWQVP